MHCQGIGLYRKHEEDNYTYLVCMALPCYVCNVIEDTLQVTPIES
mgnify:CR=1 FL=1